MSEGSLSRAAGAGVTRPQRLQRSRAPCACAGLLSAPWSVGACRATARHDLEGSGRRAMARPDKAAAVAELREQVSPATGAVLTEYRGLSVAQLKELRRALGSNAHYAVVKNTLTKIAAKDAGITDLDDLLVGPSAIAFVTGDMVEAAKGLRDFGRANQALVIK